MSDPDPKRRSAHNAAEVLRWDQIPSTRWTLVGRAGGANVAGPGETRTAMDELLRVYLPVLRGHLTTTLRVHPDRADDLLQGFLADRVVERNLIAQADASRGRFRRFLLTALNRYVTDAHRRDSSGKRQPAGGPPVSLEAFADLPDSEPTAAARFDRNWANEVLAEVMRRTRASCKADNRMKVWSVLEARILQPVSTGVPPTPHSDLARQLGLTDPAQSANFLAAGKQLFTQFFREVVKEYVTPASSGRDPEALDRAVAEEIRELWTIFAARHD